ncbi:MAG: VOC family protein [Porphyrobacter sp.]|nr:VOC family protein [Porphyrobacter sp.]
MTDHPHTLVAITPCNDIDASTAFYRRLGLEVLSDYGTYRILGDGKGWLLHLSSEAPKGWVIPGRNPNGLYLYLEDVDGLAARIADLLSGGGPSHKPWGMYEMALSDPDGTLVRIGWPSDLLAERPR